MSEIIVTARQWGNSIGITLPRDLVENENIKPSEKLVVSVRRASSIDSFFGKLKSKRSGQSIKDELKKGWD